MILFVSIISLYFNTLISSILPFIDFVSVRNYSSFNEKRLPRMILKCENSQTNGLVEATILTLFHDGFLSCVSRCIVLMDIFSTILHPIGQTTRIIRVYCFTSLDIVHEQNTFAFNQRNWNQPLLGRFLDTNSLQSRRYS